MEKVKQQIKLTSSFPPPPPPAGREGGRDGSMQQQLEYSFSFGLAAFYD
jgi:hypothetical protein